MRAKIEGKQQHIIQTRPHNAGLIVPGRQLPVAPPQTPIVIIVTPEQPARGNGSLAEFLRVGRLYHPLCRKSFVERVQIGYYAYERREEWRTCALAAAYAGAFGPQSIERPEFSYSMAVWQLSQTLGYDIGQTIVTGPTGRNLPLSDEIIKLVDDNLWTRSGVADWLCSIGL